MKRFEKHLLKAAFAALEVYVLTNTESADWSVSKLLSGVYLQQGCLLLDTRWLTITCGSKKPKLLNKRIFSQNNLLREFLLVFSQIIDYHYRRNVVCVM